MKVDSIVNGFVIDHITAGKSLEIYSLLSLEELDCPVAIIRNVVSKKMGKKDIIKIDGEVNIDFDALGYIEPDATVNVIKNEQLIEKKKLSMPEKITNVIKCKNPRCITTTEQELDHIFKLTDKENRVYRCLYCEYKAKQ